jgi:hypothetical protein
MKTETMKMANGGTVDKMKKKVKDTLKKLKPKPTGRPDKVKDFFKKKKKDKIKDKVKQKLKEKKKSKPTKTGLLSKAGIAPVSAPGGIPKVQSQKTAQKDPPKKPRKRRDFDDLLQGPKNPDRPPIKPIPMPMPQRPKGGPKPIPMPIPKRPKGGPRPIPMPSPRMTPDDRKRFRLMKDGGELKKMFGPVGAGMTRAKLKRAFDMAKKMKPTGRINADDMRRVAMMLAKGKKPVLDSKGKPVKNLFQKSKARDVPLKSPKGMRKAFGGKALKRAAKKMKKMI